MKIITILIIFVILIISSLFLLAFYSRTMEAPALVDGQLSACPHKTNCINTETSSHTDKNNQPIKLPDSVTSVSALKTLKEIIIEMDGKIGAEKENYLSATFSSSFFGFVDDFEIKINEEKRIIHFRSASRVGRSDFGTNRKRINVIQKKFIKQTK